MLRQCALFLVPDLSQILSAAEIRTSLSSAISNGSLLCKMKANPLFCIFAVDCLQSESRKIWRTAKLAAVHASMTAFVHLRDCPNKIGIFQISFLLHSVRTIIIYILC